MLYVFHKERMIHWYLLKIYSFPTVLLYYFSSCHSLTCESVWLKGKPACSNWKWHLSLCIKVNIIHLRMTHLQGSRLTPWRWMCIHAGCIIWIVFAPPLFTFALQSVMLSRPVCSQLHYPTAFGVSCLENLNSEAMPVPRNGLEIFVSTRFSLILLSWTDHCLLWLQWFAKYMIQWILNPN